MGYNPGVNPISGARNAFINGDVDVSQMGDGNVLTALNSGDVDVWSSDMWGCAVQTGGAQVGNVSAVRSAQHPMLGSAGVSFLALASDDTVIQHAGNACAIFSSVEGFNFQRLFQQTCVIQFQVKSSKAGTHCFSLVNWGNGALAAGTPKSYVMEYQVAVANVWQQIILGISFPTSLQASLRFDSGLGIRAIFPLYAGATYITTPNEWKTGRFYATANQQNLFSQNGAGFQVTDLQMELGLTPTVFDREAFDVQLKRSQRYYQQSFVYGNTPAQNAGADTGAVRFNISLDMSGGGLAMASVDLLATMRSSVPAFTFYNPSAANAQIRDITGGLNFTNTQLQTTLANGNRFVVQGNSNIGTATNSIGAFHFVANSRI